MFHLFESNFIIDLKHKVDYQLQYQIHIYPDDIRI